MKLSEFSSVECAKDVECLFLLEYVVEHIKLGRNLYIFANQFESKYFSFRVFPDWII